MSRSCFIQLWRAGDVINALPAAYIEYKKTNTKPFFMIHHEFAPILDGVSYVEPVLWQGDSRDCINSVTEASKYGVPRLMQVDGNRECPRKQASFAIESWENIGMRHLYNTQPVVFDKRDKKREKDLLDKLDNGSPFLLYNLHGFSSPFAQSQELESMLKGIDGFNAVNLTEVNADRIYDLLGLYDKAAILVTIDTATLHLANASDVPMISLHCDLRNKFLCSPPMGNTVLHLGYTEYESRKNEIIEAIKLNNRFVSHKKIHHVYQDFANNDDAKRRNAMAASTWNDEYKLGRWSEHPVRSFTRDSSSLIPGKKMPFIKDLINAAIPDMLPDEYLMLTNSDTCIRRGLTHEIRRGKSESYFSHRYDLESITRPLTVNEIERGKWYAGSDLFVFTKRWWLANRDEMPDMLIGCEAWDKILRILIQSHGGSELHSCAYHEKHSISWPISKESQYNRILAKEFLTKRNLPFANELNRFDDGSIEDLIGNPINLAVNGVQGEPATGVLALSSKPVVPFETIAKNSSLSLDELINLLATHFKYPLAKARIIKKLSAKKIVQQT